ncbi:protein of unknown function [Paenibacillaceae bacterium GAS479]|nr:protein of unknown function [Paenibacillaceae bacterium GAS479]
MDFVLKDYVTSCYTNEQGDEIYNLISKPLFMGQKVTLSFEGMNSVSSSFLNSSFIPLLDDLTFDQIKQLLKFKDSNRFINSMIIRRFEQEDNKCVN